MIEITPAARAQIQSLVDQAVVQDPALRIELDRTLPLVVGDRLHSGLTDLRVHETGHVVNEG